MAEGTWRAIDRQRKRFIRKYNRVMRLAYIEYGKPVAKHLKEFGPVGIETTIETLQTMPLQKAIQGMYVEVGVHFAVMSLANFKSSDSITQNKGLMRDKWTERMVEYFKSDAKEIIRSIYTTASNDLLRAVANIMAEMTEMGLGVIWTNPSATSMIEALFRDEWGKAAKWMAKRVAQTEMIRASNFATKMGVDDLGIDYHQAWLVASDGRERDSHRQAAEDNKNVPKGELFVVSGYFAEYPGDPNLPPEESINCRCSVTMFPADKFDILGDY